MSWTMRTARGASAHSGRRVTADISGPAPPAAVAPPPRPDPLGLLDRSDFLLLGLEVMAVALGARGPRRRCPRTFPSARRPDGVLPRSSPCPPRRPRRPAGGEPG